MSQLEDIEIAQDEVEDNPDLSQETPPDHVFIAPSINRGAIVAGESYTHHSAIPTCITAELDTECVLGVDEAGRGPVLGPMVYGVFYLPLSVEKPLLSDEHHFNDSKVLTPTVRSNLMQSLCKGGTDLFQSCGWATRVMSARDISAGMLKAAGSYNLNAQAMDATIDLIQEVLDKGVNVKEVYIDTIGSPIVYQRKLERIFPTLKITVAKKADSLYPCVSAASVCAKVTRDAALEVCYETYSRPAAEQGSAEGWGSGYPSDARCTKWLKQNMDPLFGWGAECRFSWGTARDSLEVKSAPIQVRWPEPDDDDNMKVSSYFNGTNEADSDQNALTNWFGRKVTEEVF